MIINSPSIITTDRKKDVLPPDIYIVIKYNEKKDIMKKIFFLRSILKKNINHKITGNNLTKKLPKISSSLKKLETLSPVILKPKELKPKKN